MSKYIEKIALSNIERIQIYINKKRKTISQIKAETGADYILNGGFFNSNFTPCPFVKADGVMYASANYGQWGYGWNTPTDIEMVSSPSKNNFITCIELMNPWEGINTFPKFDSAIGGKRGRSAIAVSNGYLYMYCSGDKTSDATDPVSLKNEFVKLGCTTALMLDSGGSSQCDFNGKKINSSRIVQNFILVYLKGNYGNDINYRDKLVEVAIKEIGVSEPSGDDKYISWYNSETNAGFANTVSWCAIFVSWCCRQAGISKDVIPNYASCTTAMNTFKKLGTWRQAGVYTPKKGDIIFFDWDKDPSVSEHTGIVEKVDNRYVYTIEGNSGDPGAVRRKSYGLTSTYILGYVEWDNSNVNTSIQACQSFLNEHFGMSIEVDGSFGPSSKKALIMAIQKTLNKDYGTNLSVDGSFGPATQNAFPNVVPVKTGDIAYCCQIALIANGYWVSLDGSYGPACANSVIAFQRSVGVSVDGSIGKTTMYKLLDKISGDTISTGENSNGTEDVKIEDTNIEKAQKFLNEHFGMSIEVDGSFGPASKKALVMATQKTLNNDYGTNLEADGSFGPATKNAFPDISSVTTGDIAYCIQIGLIGKGYDVDIDGSYGPACVKCVKEFQKKKKITQNGIVGKTTMYYLTK